MEESRVRYSKLSMMTATKRFSIWGPMGVERKRRGRARTWRPKGKRKRAEEERKQTQKTPIHKANERGERWIDMHRGDA